MDKLNILIIGTNSIISNKLVASLGLENNMHIFLKKHTIDYVYDLNFNYYPIESLDIDIVLHLSTLKKGSNSQIYEANIVYPLKLIEKLNSNFIFINIDTTSYEYRDNPYSHSKKVFKELLKISQYKFINLRIEHIYGYYPSYNLTSFLIENMLKNNHIDLSNGEQIRNFLYIDDLISAIIICIKNIKQLEYNSNIDITSNDNLSIKELANLIKVLTNSKSDLNFDKLSIDKREFRMVDFDNIKIKRLGWKQKSSLSTGIKDEKQEIKNEISKR